MVKRFPAAHDKGEPLLGHAGKPRPFNEVLLHHERLDIPLRARKPQVYAVSLMGDLFHENVPLEFQMDVANAIRRASFVVTKNPKRGLHSPVNHRYALLTKRYHRAAEAMRRMHFNSSYGNSGRMEWLRCGDNRLPIMRYMSKMGNIILLASVWDQASTDKACTAFAGLPIRWGLHMEPMLELPRIPRIDESGRNVSDLTGLHDESDSFPDWVVIGSENGPGARPFDLQWARDIQAQCKAAGAKYWFKGAYKQDVPEEMIVREVPW
jgi:protein gp37